MASYIISSFQSITELTGKAGVDTYTVYGTLTVDCDSRFGLNQGPNAILGNITAAPGAVVRYDSTGIRLIPFANGKTSIPNPGTVISQGSATAELVCVMSTRTGGTVTANGNMPASGYLKVRLVSGAFAAGTLSGIKADAAGPDEAGWMVVVGTDSASHIYQRHSVCQVIGNWFEVGTTSGVRGQTLQLPHVVSDGATYYPGVEIETSPGSGTYEFWPNAGSSFLPSLLSTDSRCAYVGISTSGQVYLGRGPNSGDVGHMPVAGCKVRIPGLIFQNAASTAKSVTKEPAAGMASRYNLNLTAGGSLAHNISTGAWNWSVYQGYAAQVANLHTCDQVSIGKMATRPTLDNVFAAPSTRATSIGSNALVLRTNYSGASIGTIGGWRMDTNSTSGYPVYLVNIYGGTSVAKVRAGYPGDVSAISGPIFLNSCEDVVIAEAHTVGKRVLVSASNRCEITKLVYADQARSTTGTTLASHAVEVMGQSRKIYVKSVENWPGVANVHPYSGLFYTNTASDCRFRGAGSAAVPFNTGTANLMNAIYSDGGNNTGVQVQRCWVGNLRSGLHVPSNTSSGLLLENCYTTDASKTTGLSQCGAVLRANRHNAASTPTGTTGTYDSSFWDAFTGDTTAKAVVIFNEQLSASNYTIDAGSPRFNGQGALVMASGDKATWTWTYFITGWTAVSSVALTGTNTSNYTTEFDIDTGTGFSGLWRALSNANLALLGAVSPTQGFRFKIRVGCTATHTSNKLTSIVLSGATSLGLQNAALYPLDAAVITLPSPAPSPTPVPAPSPEPGTGSSTCQFNTTAITNLERKLDDFFATYRTGNNPYWVLSSGDNLVGATYDNPYPLGLPNVSIHEMQGEIPDLNFYYWDTDSEEFKCRMEPRLTFLQRFTIAETTSMRASTDATVKDIVARWNVDKFIDLTSARTIDEVAYLVTCGILSPGRQPQILE